MKFVTDLSFTSRPMRLRAGFNPLSLFAQGEAGAYHSAEPPEGIFADVDGQTPAQFGGSIARINDQSGAGRHAIQASAALRPLWGRAPAGAPPGGPVDQGSGPAFIRFDRADDVLPTSFPGGGTFDVMVFGRQGSWIERDVTIAPGGSLNIGPDTVTGAPAGLLAALGDIVGWVAVDRTLTSSEVAGLVTYGKARGGKGLLVEGPELIANTGDPFTGTTGWTPNNATLSVVDGWLRATGTGGFVQIRSSAISNPQGYPIITRYQGRAGTSNVRFRIGTSPGGVQIFQSGNLGGGLKEEVYAASAENLHAAFASVSNTAGLTIEGRIASIKFLIPEEDL